MLSADDILRARFSAAKFRPGYDQDDVDDFLDRVVQTLRGAGTREPRRRDVTLEELDAVTFRATKWREGYDVAQVDAFLAEVRTSLISRPTPTPSGSPLLESLPAQPRPTGWRRVWWVLELMVIGERSPLPEPLVKPARAPRASMKNVTVTADAIRWKARWRVAGELATSEVGQVAFANLEYTTGRSTVHVPYALVIDHLGVVRLRVAGMRTDPALREMWTTAHLPVTQVPFAVGRAKDARRRWPEAFSLVHAYPVWTTLALMAGYMLIVVPILTTLGV